VGGEPTSLAFGNGSLWVTDGQSPNVEQVDPTTNRVRARFPVGNAPLGVAVSSGAVWAASPIEDRVARIDLGNGQTSEIPVAGRTPSPRARAASGWPLRRRAR